MATPRVARKMRTGQVDVNGGRYNPLAPFGGYKQSGIGRELGTYGLEEYFQIKIFHFPAIHLAQAFQPSQKLSSESGHKRFGAHISGHTAATSGRLACTTF